VVEEGVIAGLEFVAAVAVEIGREQRSTIELADLHRGPARAVGTLPGLVA
jgi:hypothetical protein